MAFGRSAIARSFPISATGQFCPPTAQHASREGKTVARNIIATVYGGRKSRSTLKSLGALAAIGRRTGVARISASTFPDFSPGSSGAEFTGANCRGSKRRSGSRSTGRWMFFSRKISSNISTMRSHRRPIPALPGNREHLRSATSDKDRRSLALNERQRKESATGRDQST